LDQAIAVQRILKAAGADIVWQEHLAGFAAIELEGRHRDMMEMFAVGGRVSSLAGSRNLTAVEAYDPATNTWESLPEMPTGRGGMAIGSIGGRIHTGGGEDLAAGSTHPEHEVFDTATGTWSAADDLPTPRHGIGAAVVDGRWYLIGGGTQAGLSTSDVVEIFSP
jgi:N-acetylneuraminic acid mutarotase